MLYEVNIAIIGSRCCSEYGRKMADKFSRELAKNRIGIVSGMAKGIDTIAHIGALKEKGKTIAVLGSGFEHIYPKENQGLFQKIIQEGGLIISEYPPETLPNSKLFPERNRIISGISRGTLVIEAAYRSGTSITVSLTKKQEKPVFCIPNRLGMINGVGSNEFIKQGAELVTKVEDILKRLGIAFIPEQSAEKTIKKEYKEIYELIKNETITKDELYRRMPEKSSQIEYLITMMEIEKIIKKQKDGVYSIYEE